MPETVRVNPRPRRTSVARWIAIAASTMAAVTCDLVTAPKQDSASTITVQYVGDTVLTVGTVVPFKALVTESGVPIEGARLRLTSTDSSVLAVRDLDLGTDSIIVKARGTARLRATLVGSTLGDVPPYAEVQVRAFASALAFEDSSSVTLRNIGDTLLLRVGVYGAGPLGAVRIDSNPAVQTFTSSNPNIVTVNSRGRLLAHGNGVDTITAAVDTSRVQIVVRVLQRLARFQYSAPSIQLSSLNQDSVFSVVPLDAGGTAIPAGTAGLTPPVFTTLSQGVVTVQPSGSYGVRLTSVGNGSTRLRLQSGTVDTTLDVTVGQLATSLVIAGPRVDTILAINDTLPLLASAFDARNIQIRGRGVTWFQQNSAIVRVDPASGIVRGVALGSGRIYAQMDGALDSVTVVVRNVPTSVRTTPAVFLTSVHDSIALVDTVFNRLGVPVSGVAVSWRALDTTIAQVGAASGIVEALAPGNTLVIGTIAGGIADTTAVTVENRVASVAITTPDTALASIGDTVTLRTTLRNARGGPLANAAALWTSTRPTVVSVQNGFLTAAGNGTSTIYAADPLNPARFDSVRVTVTNAPASLALDRTLDTLRAVGTSLQYTADVRNARGALLLNPTVTWHTTNPAVATVSLGGLVTGRGIGTVKIYADTSFGGRTVADTATLVIFNDAKTLAVSPKSVTVPSIGATTALSASAANSVGGAVASASFSWSSSDPAIATVDTSGNVTGIGIGSAVITVRLGVLQDQATVTVTNAPDTVRFAVGAVTLGSAGDTVIPVVRLTNALGATLPRTAAQWLSDDALIARVTADGAIIAVGRGVTVIRARNALNVSRTDSVTVTVTNAPVQLTVAPHQDTLPAIGRTTTLAASAFNARGQVILGEVVSWVSRDPASVTVDPATGLVTARAANGGGSWIVGSVSGAAGPRSDSALIIVRNLAASVAITPGTLFLGSVGDSSLLTASPLNALGKPISGAAVTWSSSNPALLGFQPTGSGAAVTGPVTGPDTMRVRALATGAATVTATVDGVTSQVYVSISNPPTTVSLTSGNLTLASVGDTVSPAADLRNALGVVLARSAVTWSSSDPAVATVSGSGLVTATGAGTAVITATSPASAALNSSITVTVTNAPFAVTLNYGDTTLTAVGRSLSFAATVRNAAGGIISNPAVTWSTTNAGVVSIGAQSGVATAVAAGGPVSITANAGGVIRSVQVTVTNFAVVLTLSPDSVTILNLGGTAQLVALGSNDLNALVPATAISWTSLDPTIATVSGSGLVTATSLAANTGVARIVATTSGKLGPLADTSWVTVVNAPTGIAFTGGPVTLASIGDQSTPPVTITNSGGGGLARSAVTWSSSAPSVATVSGSGTITAVSAGSAQITAVSPFNPAVTATLAVTVTNAPTSVVLNQTAVTLTALGRTTTFSAVVRNARGDPIAGQSVTWSSSGAAVTVGPSTGVATAAAVTAGVTITATVTGAPAVTATATVAVTNNPASVSASPGSVALTALGATQALTPTVRNDLGAAIAGAAVSYTSGNSAIASVSSPAGVVTAVAVGATTVTVDAGGGVTTTVAVTVSNDLTQLAIVPATGSITSLGDTLFPAVTFRNALNAALPRTAATWISSNPAIATVSADGVITGVAAGVDTVVAVSPANNAIRDSIFVTVANVAASVVLNTSRDTMTAIGQTFQPVATVRNARGAVIPGAVVTWSSTNTAVAVVAADGTISAVAPGTAVILAASGPAPADSDTVVVSSHPGAIWVNKDAPAGPTRLGTLKAPFTTIQAAASAASTGDTIYVMKATTAYAEAVALTNGVVLAASPADAAGAGCSSSSYCAATLLPVLAHGFGNAAVTASANTSVSLRNLVIVHSVDGPAVDANGANLDAENVFVNPAGVAGSPLVPTGRGIWVRNAPDSARIRRVQVTNVKGYGIRLENTFNSRVDTVTVTAVDTANGFSSRAGVHLVGGDGARVANAIVLATGATVANMDGIRVSGTTNARLVADSVDGARFGVRADNATFLDSNVAVRQAVTGLLLEGGVTQTSERTRIARTSDVGVSVRNLNNIVTLRRARFDTVATAQTDSLAIDVLAGATGTQLTVDSSNFRLGAGRAVRMLAGTSLSMSADTIAGDSTRSGTPIDSSLAVIRTLNLTGNTLLFKNRITDFARRYAMQLGSGITVTVDSNLIARNRAGIHLATDITIYVLRGNDIYDQRGATPLGMTLSPTVILTPANQLKNWWGDGRGPRRAGLTTTNVDSVATGDSVPVAAVLGSGRYASASFTGNLQGFPSFAGTGAAGLRIVRGSGQTLPSSGSSSPAPFALTVRVVDAGGRPVSGVSVAASFTSGCSGDNLGGGVCLAAAPATTNSSGLAEFPLTVGSGTHTVTIGVTAASRTVTFTVNRL